MVVLLLFTGGTACGTRKTFWRAPLSSRLMTNDDRDGRSDADDDGGGDDADDFLAGMLSFILMLTASDEQLGVAWVGFSAAATIAVTVHVMQ